LYLTLQIAAGIVLAYAVIANRQILGRFVAWIAVLVLIVAAIGVVVWLGGEGVKAASPHLPKLGMYLVGLLVICAGLIGGICLLQIAYALGWRDGGTDGSSNVLVAGACVANIVLVYLVTWPILSYTPLGDWYGRVDNWSRKNGFADLGVMTVAAIVWLWPIVPLWFLSARASPQPEQER